MRNTVTIFLLIVMVSIQTPIGQLFKLPLLIEHFMKHRQHDGVSLCAFLTDHYAGHEKDADFPEDDQLPFKNINFFSMGYAIVTPTIQMHVLAPLPAEKKIVFPQIYTPQQHLAGIFRPPRV